MRLMISELQRQLSELDSSSSPSKSDEQQIQLPVPPRRVNPFNRTNESPIAPPIAPPKSPINRPLRIAPPPPIVRDTANIPIKDDNELTMQEESFSFLTIHEYFGKSWKKVAKIRQEAKEMKEKPLILF